MDGVVQRVLVTGAAGGIGRATCLEFVADALRRGLQLKIAAADCVGAPLEPVIEELRAAGAQATAHVADLADPSACARLGEEAVAACGGIDILASVAGITRSGALSVLEVADWNRVFVPLRRIGTPEDVARALVHLAGPDCGYAAGIDLRLDGGLCDGVIGTIPGMPR